MIEEKCAHKSRIMVSGWLFYNQRFLDHSSKLGIIRLITANKEILWQVKFANCL